MANELTEIAEVMKDILEILREYADTRNWDGPGVCIIGSQLAGLGLQRWQAYFKEDKCLKLISK